MRASQARQAEKLEADRERLGVLAKQTEAHCTAETQRLEALDARVAVESACQRRAAAARVDEQQAQLNAERGAMSATLASAEAGALEDTYSVTRASRL